MSYPEYRTGQFVWQYFGEDWVGAPDDEWGTVTRANWTPEEATFVGCRNIGGDGLNNVFKVPGGYEAQSSTPGTNGS